MEVCFGGLTGSSKGSLAVRGSTLFLLLAMLQTFILFGSLYVSCRSEFDCSLFLPTLSYLAAYRGYDRLFCLSYTLYAFVLLLFFLATHSVYRPFVNCCTQTAMLTFAVLACISLPGIAVVDEMSSSYLVPMDILHRGLVTVACTSVGLWATLSLCGICGLRRTVSGPYHTEQRLLIQYILIVALAAVIAGYIWMCQFYNAVNWLITDYNAALAEWFAVLVATFLPYNYAVSFPGFAVELAFRSKSKKQEN